ncbi:unnamed protein product [Urochloa humidicola]
MAAILQLLLHSLLALAVLWQAGRLLHRLWWCPRRLEQTLRSRGLHGTRYRLVAGDLGVRDRLNRQAQSMPPLPGRCHDIAPRVLPFIVSNLRVHGEACISWFGPVPRVTVTDPGIAREVLANKPGSGGLEKPQLGRSLFKLLAAGLIAYEGDKWARHRRILSPAFHLDMLKRMLPAFSACCEELVGRWAASLGSDGSCEVDVWPEVRSLTGDVISRTAFGSSYLEGRRIFQLQAERLTGTVRKMFIPGYMYLPTKNNIRMHQISNEVNSILRGLVGRRVEAIRKGKSDTNDDLLGLLLESNMSPMGEGMTTEDVIEECKLFYLAGTETTSSLLTWTMVLLSMHPEWQDRAREEVVAVFGREDTPDYQGLTKLKTVTMILHEVLRLYPPSTLSSRKTCREVEIGGVKYPAGVIIELPVLLIHHDQKLWGSDAHEFRPERFAEGISKASKEPGAFLPFGWGPRICIGQSFALLEAKMALCVILGRFEFELAPSYTHAPRTMVTLHPMHGAPIKLRVI